MRLRELSSGGRRVRSEAELGHLAAELADRLAPGDVVHLVGDLGAGKTTFVRHAARRLGVEDEVTSPTFAIAHVYGGGRSSIGHLDLYRSDELTVETAADLAPYLDEDALVFIEWPDAGRRVLPAPTHVVTLRHVAGDPTARDVLVETVRR